ncbi:hypothetical protein RK21_02807 [Pseudomonas plecoglossicida]|uniref:glutaminase n=1 Tax=Pseudomonas taiwanensis SJ9 TaxID=1388762 RepID=V7DHL8_9PSED|nr:hypothetical protein RK21_02807 [Pseudomonas plecoglossicida]ESW40881.1 hypothetical protein O164_03600 [Pseudomonas taiwanensis SJ9]
MQTLLNEILEEVRPLIGKGKVADYIPALADVPANQLGIAVYGNDGSYYCAGDALVPFSVQSISKVFSLVQAIGHTVSNSPSTMRAEALSASISTASCFYE